MTQQKTRYRERSPWPGLAYVVLWGVVVLSCYPILAGWGGGVPGPMRVPLVLSIVGLVAGLVAVVNGLTVLIQESRIIVHLGRVPLVRKTIDFSEVVSLRSVTYRPLREFGGWGVRGVGKRRAWTARGSRAVALTLSGDRELLIGSDHPQRLEERIRALAGDALSGG